MKPFEDIGHAVWAKKPLRLRRYEAGNLPDPGQCVDSIIIVNDRLDGVPRARLAVSNGASWDHLAWLEDVRQPVHQAVAVRPAEIDLTPIVRQAVEAALPAMLPAPVKVIEQQAPQIDVAPLAAAVLEMTSHFADLQRENADLRARVEFLEQHAIARAEIKAA